MPYTQEDHLLDEALLRILRTVIKAVHERANKDKASQALLCLLVRCAHGWGSIRTLRRYSPDEETYTIDAAVLLRCIFDAYLQANLIHRDPAKRIEQAELYLDYAHVDRFKAASKTMQHDNALTQRLKVHPQRTQGEQNLRQQYERVKARYYVGKAPNGGTPQGEPKLRDKWYKGNLRELAEAANKLAEYDTFITQFSGCVHSGAFAVQAGPLVTGAYLGMLASMLVARVLLMNIEYNRLSIPHDDMDLVSRLAKSVLDESPEPAK